MDKQDLEVGNYYLIASIDIDLPEADNDRTYSAPFLCQYIGEGNDGSQVFEILYNEYGFSSVVLYDSWIFPNESVSPAPQDLIDKFESRYINYN